MVVEERQEVNGLKCEGVLTVEERQEVNGLKCEVREIVGTKYGGRF